MMETAALQVTINTQAARADLNALAKAFDRVEGSFNSLDKAFSKSAVSIDKNATKAVKGFDKVARVAALLGKIKISTASVDAIHQFTKAIDGLGRARSISDAKITSLRKFMVLAATIKAPTGVQGLAQFMQVISNVKAPSASTVTRLQDFFKAIQTFRAPPSTTSLTQMLATFGSIKVPTTTQIKRLQELLRVLGSAKNVTGAKTIARDLDMIAASAGRAGNAINNMPARMRQMGAGAAIAHGNVRKLSGGIHDLNNRMSLGYQAGTLFTTLFSTFTLGAFFRSIYQATIDVAKLEKAMIFATASIEGSKKASAQAMGIMQGLGLDISKTAEAYSRFVISASAAGFTLQAANDIFSSIGLALQVVGASAEQTQYAMYGLTQMMSKGKVSSEEFNRQIGEQIPGNAALGARALSTLEGRVVSVTEFFKKMSLGLINSKTFAPAWATEVRNMFKPLESFIAKRPDVMLAKLKNAFFLFSAEVGKMGFMGALGDSFVGLTSRFVTMEKDIDGIETARLSDAGKAIAKEWGGNLAEAVTATSKVFMYLADHINEVVMAAKGLIALRLGATVVQWGGAAAAASASTLAPLAAGIGGMVRNQRGVRGATYSGQAFGPRMPAGSAAGAVGRGLLDFGYSAGFGPVMNGTRRAQQGMGRAIGAGGRGVMGLVGGIAGAGSALRANPATAAMRGLQTAAKGAGAAVVNTTAMASRGFLSLVAPTRLAAAGAGILKTGMMLLGPVGIAAAVGLAMFGDKAIQVGEKTTTTNDMIGAGFGMLTKGIGDWWNKSNLSLTLFGKKGTDMKALMGDVVANIVAGFVTMGQVIGNVMLAIGNTVNALLVGPLSSIINVFDKLMNNKPGEAWAALTQIPSNSMNSLRSAAGNLGNAAGAFGNFQANKDQMVNTAAATTAERERERLAAAAEVTTLSAEEQRINAALQARQQGDIIAERTARTEMAMNAIQAGPLGRNDPQALLDGFRASRTTVETAADATERAATAAEASAAAAERVVGAAGGAAAGPAGGTVSATQTVPQWFVRSLIQQESSNQAGRVGPQTQYGRAYGLMQMLPGTARNTARDNGMEYNEGLMGGTGADARAYQERLGTAHAQDLYERYNGDLEQVALAYHGGTNTRLWGPKTHQYNADVLARGGMTPSGQAAGSQRSDVRAALNGYTPRSDGMAFVQGAGDIGSNGTGQPGQTVMSQADLDDLEADATRLNDSYQKIAQLGDPAADGVAAYAELGNDLAKFMETVASLEARNLKPEWIDPEVIQRAIDRTAELMQDAINPLGKDNRLLRNTQAVMELRARGASEEADWEERIIALREEGRNVESAAFLAREESEREAYRLAQMRIATLQSEFDLTKQIGDIRVSQIARNGSALDGEIANRLNSSRREGETMDQARARMGPEAYGNLVSGAQMADTERMSASMQSAQRGLAEQGAMARLRGSDRDRQENFKGYLEDLLGVTGRTVEEMERMNPQVTTFARGLADAKTALDNPPGFQRWVDGLTPLKDALEDIKASFADGLSDGITAALMGEDFDWGDLAKNLRRQWTKSVVDNALGSMFQTGIDRSNGAAGPAAANDNGSGGGGFMSRIGALFGFGGGNAAPAAGNPLLTGDPAAATAAASAYTITATTVTVNAQSLTGGAGPGVMGQLASALTSATGTTTAGGAAAPMAGNGMMSAAMMAGDLIRSGGLTSGGGQSPSDITRMLNTTLPGTGGASAPAGGGGGGFMGSLGKMIGPAATVIDMLFGKKEDKPQKTYAMGDVNGIIGSMSTNTIDATQIGAKSNPIADILNLAMQVGGSYFGAGNYGQSYGMGGDLKNFIGSFREGGISTMPVEWHKAPSYSEGTGNTSGIPAMLHPNEAVIPLSRGRKVPVEMAGGGGGSQTNVNNFTIVANDPNEFRQAEASIQRRQNRAAQRAKLRDLS